MAVCEMCGKDTQVSATIVEGSELNVCENCGKYGKAVQRPVVRSRAPVQAKPEIVEMVVSDYAQLIRKARETKGMTQKDFALSVNEKESVVQKLETGSLTPSLSMAKKLERLLKVKLVEVQEETKVDLQSKNSGPMTIGDILKFKRR